MASKLGLLLISSAFSLLCSYHYCSASGRPLDPKMAAAATEFGPDPPYLLKPTFPLPFHPAYVPMPLQQPITPPPPPFPAGQDGDHLTPAFPFPHLPPLPKFPPFPFIPTMPTIPALPTVPFPPQFVDSGSSSPGIGNEGRP
ncbi:RNA-binding protein [Salix suchowensis]|nr:RNA-binding protein [Salix suchowensis]